MFTTRPRAAWSWPFLGFLPMVQLWAAHLCAFFPHEYAHSFVAWLLGWKANPLALDYAHPSAVVLLLQLGINQNVNEGPIFASGHPVEAAIIAAAGLVIGNGFISYPLSRLGYAMARRQDRRGWAMFFYWTTVASIGNFIDYVPIRVFSEGGDMYSLERGFGWSPWTVLIVLGIPTAAILGHFLLRIEPDSMLWLFPESAPRPNLLLLLTSGVLFSFYGATGLLEGGPIAHQLSRLSVFLLLPVATIGSWLLLQRSNRPTQLKQSMTN